MYIVRLITLGDFSFDPNAEDWHADRPGDENWPRMMWGVERTEAL